MKITVLKSTVESALAPVLKMVSNAKLPADFHPTLTFQSDKQSLSVGCTLPEQQLSVVLPDAVFDEKNTSFDVSLEMFRRLVASASHIIPEKPWTYDHGIRDKRGENMFFRRRSGFQTPSLSLDRDGQKKSRKRPCEGVAAENEEARSSRGLCGPLGNGWWSG